MKKSYGFTIIEVLLIFVIVAILAATGWYVYRAHNKTTDTFTNADAANSSVTKYTKKEASRITSVDETWNLYTNSKAGFSVKIPKLIRSEYGSYCKKEASSYRPNAGTVSTTVVEDVNNFYITESYTYQLTDEQRDSSGYSNFSGCKKVEPTPDVIKQSEKSGSFIMIDVIPIKIVDAANNDDVVKQSKVILGTSDITVSIGPGTEKKDVEARCINTESLEACPLNYTYYLWYYSIKKKLAYISLGQSYKLMSPKNDGSSYDKDVVASFKLL